MLKIATKATLIAKPQTGLRSGQGADREWLCYSDTGGLTQYGAYVDTLHPGARS
jgi:hypothetical protein